MKVLQTFPRTHMHTCIHASVSFSHRAEGSSPGFACLPSFLPPTACPVSTQSTASANTEPLATGEPLPSATEASALPASKNVRTKKPKLQKKLPTLPLESSCGNSGDTLEPEAELHPVEEAQHRAKKEKTQREKQRAQRSDQMKPNNHNKCDSFPGCR